MALQLDGFLVLDSVRDLYGDEQELMAWVRYDDQFHANPKVTAVIVEDAAALALHVLANTWTNGQKRMGFIPAHQPGVLVCDKEQGVAWASVLVRHGLWHDWANAGMCAECSEEYSDLPDDVTGYIIHNAAHYRAPERDRTTPGTPAELSEKRRAAGRKGGKTTAQKREQKKQPARAKADGDDSKSSNLLFGGVSKVSTLPLGGVSPEPEPVVASNEATNQPPPEAAADEPRPLTLTQRSKAITDAYALAEPMCRWPAVNGVVMKAIKAEKWTDPEIQAALLRLAAEGRSVTVDALRYELQGMPASNARAASTGTDGRALPRTGALANVNDLWKR